MYFPRNFITTAKHVMVVEAIKYLGKYVYMTIYVRKKTSIWDKIALLYFT